MTGKEYDRNGGISHIDGTDFESSGSDIQSDMEEFGCTIETWGTWVDSETRTLRAEATLQSKLGSFRLHYVLPENKDLTWSFYRADQLPDSHKEVLHYAAAALAPISHDVCLDEGYAETEDNEEISSSGDLKPVCQASVCEATAQRAIPSPDGHPANEWKLCDDHAEETDYRDPYRYDGIDWTLRKLYYSTKNGGIVSHNVV